MTAACEHVSERLSRAIDNRAARCVVIGAGFIGSTLMDAIVNAGFRAVALDRSSTALERFTQWMQDRHADNRDRWAAASEPEPLAEADVVMIAVRALIRDDGEIDLEPLDSAAAMLRRYPRERLILLSSTVPCGSTRRFAASLGAGPGTFVAHAPERLSAGQDQVALRRMPHLVGGVDALATGVAAEFLRTFCDEVVPVTAPEVSELSKLLENAFLSVGIALVNEVTHLALDAGISALEVCQAAATKQAGYYPFYPGPGVGGHCLPNDLRILAETTRRSGRHSSLLEAAAKANSGAPASVVRRLETILIERRATLTGARVLLIGVGFKVGSPDTTASPAFELVRLLRSRGAEPVFTDSTVSDFYVDGPVQSVPAAALQAERFDACVILSGDRALTGAAIARASAVVLDTGGGRLSPGIIEGVHTL